MFESIGSNIGRKCSKTATLYQMKQQYEFLSSKFKFRNINYLPNILDLENFRVLSFSK